MRRGFRFVTPRTRLRGKATNYILHERTNAGRGVTWVVLILRVASLGCGNNRYIPYQLMGIAISSSIDSHSQLVEWARAFPEAALNILAMVPVSPLVLATKTYVIVF